MDTALTFKTHLLAEVADGLKKKGLGSLRDKLLLALPDNIFPRGSDLWWEQGNLKGKQDISSGRVFDTLS